MIKLLVPVKAVIVKWKIHDDNLQVIHMDIKKTKMYKHADMWLWVSFNMMALKYDNILKNFWNVQYILLRKCSCSILLWLTTVLSIITVTTIDLYFIKGGMIWFTPRCCSSLPVTGYCLSRNDLRPAMTGHWTVRDHDRLGTKCNQGKDGCVL